MKEFKLKRWYPSLPTEWIDNDFPIVVVERENSEYHLHPSLISMTRFAIIPEREVERNKKFWERVRKVKDVLLTTQDGIELFEGDVYYFIWLSSPASCQKINTVYNHILEPLANNTNWSENARFFAKKENAERYINLNSPKYSIKDIIPIVNNWSMCRIDEDNILNFLAKNNGRKRI